MAPADLASLGDLESIPSGRRVLTQPTWLYFEDRPGLKDKFGPILVDVVIPRPPEAWPAMRVAGVRDLSKAVDVGLTECENPRTSETVHARLAERQPLIDRVIEQFARSTDVVDRDVLKTLDVQVVDALQVRYAIPIGADRRVVTSDPEPPTALFVRADDTVLYHEATGATPPWTAIARELALAVFPEAEPGVPASAFQVALAAIEGGDAAATLDMLGFPHLAALPVGDHGAGSILPQLGSEDIGTPPEPDDQPDGEPDYEPEAGDDATQEGEEQPPDEPQAGEPPPPGSTRPKRKQSRLRGYVVPGADGGEREPGQDSNEGERRTAIEEAGVLRVVEAERAAGREPEVKPPFHPGFDIESIGNGETRLIEVKATSGDWGALGVGLSRRQFETSLLKAESYWLYVVERAERGDFRIHQIRDPGRRVGQFLFDDGWRGAAEPTEDAGE